MEESSSISEMHVNSVKKNKELVSGTKKILLIITSISLPILAIISQIIESYFEIRMLELTSDLAQVVLLKLTFSFSLIAISIAIFAVIFNSLMIRKFKILAIIMLVISVILFILCSSVYIYRMVTYPAEWKWWW